MGGIKVDNIKNNGSSFQPLEPHTGATSNTANTSGTGYPNVDTISGGSGGHTARSESCCKAQDDLSEWFNNDLSTCGKVLFVLGSILTGSLLYLFTLLGFAISPASDNKNS